jgi:signal transduction histidine kinase
MTQRDGVDMQRGPATRVPSAGTWTVAAVSILAMLEAVAASVVPSNATSLSPETRIAALAVGIAFVGAGLVGWRRRPDNFLGPLMVLAGFLWNLGRFDGAAPITLAVAARLATALALGAVAYINLAVPSGRPGSRLDSALLAVALVAWMCGNLFDLTILPVRETPAVHEPNPLYLPLAATVRDGIAAVLGIAMFVVIAAILGRVAWRWRAASSAARRALAPVYAAGIAVGGTSFSVEALVAAGVVPRDVASVIEIVSFILFPIGVLAGLFRAHLARTAVADLVVELGRTPEPARLRDALARALGDPNLELLRWSQDRGAYVDGSGMPTDPATRAGTRAVTLLERVGTPLAAIVHDPALLDDPGLMTSVATAMRLEAENERLRAEVEAQLAEVVASRARIVEAGDAERKRVERNLHDGAQQRLVALSLALRLVRSRLGPDADPDLVTDLDSAAGQLRAAIADLRELARGIHPAVLTEAGLGAAILALADRSPIPVAIESVPAERLPAPVEATAYYVVAEGLTNVAKYAHAPGATVEVSMAGGMLAVAVHDDGVGGADPALGSGLRGLADRVEALGGSFVVSSLPGFGTTLRAAIPLASGWSIGHPVSAVESVVAGEPGGAMEPVVAGEPVPAGVEG